MSDMRFFKPAARYPADPRAVFILVLSVFSGLTALLLSVAPDSLEQLLPEWAVALWSVNLALGSATALIGMLRQTVTGIVLEQVGSVMVGASAIFYSLLILWTVGPSAIQTVGIILAWGLACLARWAQLQVLLHNAAKRKDKLELLERISAEIDQRYAVDAERKRNRPGAPQ